MPAESSADASGSAGVTQLPSADASGSAGSVITPTAAEAPRLAFGFAIRNAIGVAIPLVAGVLVDDVAAGAVAGGGALITGFADVGDTRAHRAIAMLATAALGALSTFVGVLASDSEIASLLVTGLWGLGTGLLVAGGPILGVVAITLIVAALEPGDLVLGLICAACMVPAYAFLWIDYTRFTTGIAGAAVALAAMLGLPEPTAALDRFVDTLVGLALILAFLAALREAPRRGATARG